MSKYDESLSGDARLLDEYLNQYRICIRSKKTLELRRRNIAKEFDSPLRSVNYDGMPHGSSTGLGSATISLQLDEIDTQLREQIERASETLNRITGIICLLPENSNERMIIEAKYIDRLKWHQISRACGFERAQTIRYWRKGLNKLIECEEVRKIIEQRKRERNA